MFQGKVSLSLAVPIRRRRCHRLEHTFPALGLRRGGNLSTATDAESRVTDYDYDAANHLTSVIAPDLTETTYTYDDAGNLATRTDANLNTTTYDYDDANRL